MSKKVDFVVSSLGMKVLMALSGIILFGFVVGHMLGNLQIYLGPERLNHYAELLHAQPALLWGVRSVLAFCAVIHLITAAQVWWRNTRGRPISYKRFRPPAVDYAAKTMVYSGPIIAAFVVYHLLHLTFGTVHADFVPNDVYHNVVSGFQAWPVATTYIVACLLLGLHLYHGLWSLFQTLGWDHPVYSWLLRPAAVVFAALISLGNVSIPLSVLTGVVG